MDSTRPRYHRCGPTAVQGTAQFGRDVAAVAALLAPYACCCVHCICSQYDLWQIHVGPALQGAAQFGRDVAAVAALLAPYTRRPLAYFRELADAATLLALPADHVRFVPRLCICTCS